MFILFDIKSIPKRWMYIFVSSLICSGSIIGSIRVKLLTIFILTHLEYQLKGFLQFLVVSQAVFQ